MDKIYKETYFLSANEGNAEQEMALTILVSKIIDIATAHANSLGIGNPSMTEMHAGWILSRLTVEMDSYPVVNSYYTLETWVESFNRHFSERSFRISDPDGKVYGYARSIWMVMDTVNHTNVGLSHLSLPPDMIPDEKVPIERQTRHVPIAEKGMVATASKETLPATAPPFRYRFEYSDIDYYRHVNTVRYVNILINRFSLAEHDATFIRRLELSFLHEAKYGMDTTILRADQDSDLRSAFQLSRTDNGQPLLFARIIRDYRKR